MEGLQGILNKKWPDLWKILALAAGVVLCGVTGVDFMGFGLHFPENEHRYGYILAALLSLWSVIALGLKLWAEAQRQKSDAVIRAAQIEAGISDGNDTVITRRE